jgi:hypothetical protein
MFTELLRKAEVYNKVTSKYHRVDTEGLYDSIGRTLTAQGYTNWTAKISRSNSRMSKSTKHFIRIRLGNAPTIVGECIPEIVLFNSFNGEGSLGIAVGLYRLVCSNGLTVGQDLFSEKVRHVRGPNMNGFLEDFESKIVWAIKYIKEKLEPQVQQMKNTKLSYTQMANIVEGLTLTPAARDNVVVNLQTSRRRAVESEDNLWNIYNIVNETLRRRGRSEFANEKKNVNLMDDIIRLAA